MSQARDILIGRAAEQIRGDLVSVVDDESIDIDLRLFLSWMISLQEDLKRIEGKIDAI